MSSYISRFISGLLRVLQNWGKLSKTTGEHTIAPSLVGSAYRSKQHKLELCKDLTGGQSAMCTLGDFWTAYIV